MTATRQPGAVAPAHNGEISFWMRTLAPETPSRPPLEGDIDCDVAIIGAGFTGLWTAYYLAQRDPSLRIVVLEARQVGYGASGRNGGWLSHLVAGNRDVYARAAGAGGHDGVVRLQRAMVEAIDEVLQVADRERIEMDARRGGNLAVGTTAAGMARLRGRLERDRAYGLREDEAMLLSPSEVAARIAVSGARGGLFYPMVARIQPARLALGLAEAVERRSVRIYERSQAQRIVPAAARMAAADQGASVSVNGAAVRAGSVLICTEGYGGPLPGRRRLIPVNSSMIVTEPLGTSDWERIGWTGAECLSDSAHAFIYAQRTADDRIAIGGRGRPYRFASATGGDGATAQDTVEQLLARLRRYFPGTPFAVEHAWSGVLGVTRDWCAGVELDRRSGIGHALGYAGHGVAASNLCGRILAELTLGESSDRTSLPVVGHRTRDWEPEPLRWLGVHGLYRIFRLADRWEERSDAPRTPWMARAAARLAGLE